jgi:flagellar assembly protein FliH
MSVNPRRGFLRIPESEQQETTAEWDLPNYAGAEQEAKETAYNYDPGWMPEAHADEFEQPMVLTEEQIELIKQGAYNEGLGQGQEAGFAQGFEQGKNEGFTEGKSEGHTAGLAEGLAAGTQQIDDQVKQLVMMVDQFSEPMALLNSQVERQLIDMVLALTREVIHVEVQTNPQLILDTFRESVETLPVNERDIQIFLHPTDVEQITTAYGEEAIAQKTWTLHAEPSLNQGDIKISAGNSSVNYLIEERIKTVLQKFCGVNRHQEQQSTDPSL